MKLDRNIILRQTKTSTSKVVSGHGGGPSKLSVLVQLISTSIMMRIKHTRAPVVSKLKRRADTDVPTCMNGRPTKRHQIVDDSLIEGFSKLLSQRYLDDLPQEILLNIFQHFAEPWVLTDDLADWEVYTLDRESRIRQQTLISLTKTCRRLNLPATSILYWCAHLPTHRSVLRFLNSIRIQPNLAKLVKQVSCPHEVLMSLTYAFHRPLGDDGSSSTTLVRPMSCPIGVPRDVDQPLQSYYAYSRINVHRIVLDSILERVPGIRALSAARGTGATRSAPCRWSIFQS